jgi:acyl transferase domain-containing protein
LDESKLSIAALNGPTSTVVSGDPAAISELAAEWTAKGRKVVTLRVNHAFHSPHVDAILADFRTVAEKLTWHQPSIPIVSAVSGQLADVANPDYWVTQLRQPVRFHDGVRTLHDLGVRTFMEVGPDAALTPLVRACLADEATILPTMRRDHPEDRTVLTALAGVHTAGGNVNWPAVLPGHVVDLPTYAFQSQHFWLPASGRAATSAEDRLWQAANELGLTAEQQATLRAMLPEPEEQPKTEPDLAQRLAEASIEEQEALLLELVRTHTADVLGYERPEAIGAQDSFQELGFSSFSALEVSTRLRQATGIALAPVVVFECPTPAALARYLHTELSR